jgi:arsenate reductase
VRKDSLFAKLGLDAADYESAEAVVDVIARHKMLMQRPVVVRADRAIIGRPKERVWSFLSSP